MLARAQKRSRNEYAYDIIMSTGKTHFARPDEKNNNRLTVDGGGGVASLKKVVIRRGPRRRMISNTYQYNSESVDDGLTARSYHFRPVVPTLYLEYVCTYIILFIVLRVTVSCFVAPHTSLCATHTGEEI